MKRCPKCGYERQPRDDKFVSPTKCPRCGVIYYKAEAKLIQEQAEEARRQKFDNWLTESADEKQKQGTTSEVGATGADRRGLIPCPECKKRFSASANSCPWCGYVLTPKIVTKIRAEQKAKVEKTERGCGIGCLVIVLLFLFFAIFSSQSGPDCWKCAYKRAYCITLVDLGVAKGPCDSLAVPDECWEKHLRRTQAGWDQGRKDVIKKYTTKLKDLRIPNRY